MIIGSYLLVNQEQSAVGLRLTSNDSNAVEFEILFKKLCKGVALHTCISHSGNVHMQAK